MDVDIAVALISGGFLLLNTFVAHKVIKNSEKARENIEEQSALLSKKFDESSKINLIEGESETVSALKLLTLKEKKRVRVTRFNSRAIQKRGAYYQAMKTRILGGNFDGKNYAKLERYYRLTSLNSQENKESLIAMIDEFSSEDSGNYILRITADKNDFELLIFEESKVAALCFHDVSNLDVVHSCMIVRDNALFENFLHLYHKLWHEDILLEIDFSRGADHIKRARDLLSGLSPIERSNTIETSAIESVNEARNKIIAFESLHNSN